MCCCSASSTVTTRAWRSGQLHKPARMATGPPRPLLSILQPSARRPRASDRVPPPSSCGQQQRRRRDRVQQTSERRHDGRRAAGGACRFPLLRASVSQVAGETTGMDELRSSASAVPGRSLRAREAEASASSARAPGVRPERRRDQRRRRLSLPRESVARSFLPSARRRGVARAITMSARSSVRTHFGSVSPPVTVGLEARALLDRVKQACRSCSVTARR